MISNFQFPTVNCQFTHLFVLHSSLNWLDVVNRAVVEFVEFCVVPAVGGAYELAGDALELVDVGAAALGTSLQLLVSIFIAAVHAAVAVVVD